MGLLMRPRRPLMRVAAGAATAGIAYHAGKRRAAEDQAAAYQQQQYQPPPQYQQPPPQYQQPPPEQQYQQPQYQQAPQAAGGPTTELERLVSLHQSGALTDEEFAAAKAQVLGG
ncbi:SHOCT domain-containing protein [Actinocatenispora rupis]|uniref:SHOCT domain-containing protein n=1 Tax=Actinocatenispora rupis TaxID=519421 RepID=A0A8J3JDU9_9ACTN|nr:SHOCT domain-containing protein [Actinocatenispora rupis]GID14667.1 hypothetical protein Aru02nite_55560 [Actinocatenispora rupis]